MKATDAVTYFWSGSNRPGEIAALAKHDKNIGVAVVALDKGGRGEAELVNIGADDPVDNAVRIVANVAQARGGSPIVMFDRDRCGDIPTGDTTVEVAGRKVVVGFRKIAANVARSVEGGKNMLGDLLKGMFGEAAGEAGAGHKVAIELTPAGWQMTAAELDQFKKSDSKVFVDSGAFGEVKFDKATGRFVDVKPITHDDWTERLAAYKRIALALGDRAFLVAPDKVGDQAETLARLARYAGEVRELRALGANVIVPLQKGALSQAAFDVEVEKVLGFGDYVRGIPSKKAAATVEEIAALSRTLPAAARVHLLGLGPFGERFDEVIEAIARPAELVFCDSVRIKALVGRTNGRNNGPRILTALIDAAREFLGLADKTRLDSDESFAVKFLALDSYFATASTRS